MSEEKKPTAEALRECTVAPARVEHLGGGVREARDEELAVEASIELVLNGRPLVRLRCTPAHVEELARGFLLTEGWVDEPAQILRATCCRGESRVEAEIDVPESRIREIQGRLSIASGCGGGMSRDGLRLDPDCGKKFDLTATLGPAEIQRLSVEFERRSGMYRQTHCVHSAGIFEAGEFLSFAEDLGRHNAVDKAVGMLGKPGVVFSNKGLFTSGRVTLDIASKMARLRGAFIVSRATPSFEAVKTASEFHVAVVGRLRQASMKVYSAPWRIQGPE